MSGSHNKTALVFTLSRFFWMISIPCCLILCKRASAFSPVGITARSLRSGVRVAPISRSMENKLLIARKLKLDEAEVEFLLVGEHWLFLMLPIDIARDPYLSFLIIDVRGLQVDPGEVKGTKLRILKYPHPKVVCCTFLTGRLIRCDHIHRRASICQSYVKFLLVSILIQS